MTSFKGLSIKFNEVPSGGMEFDLSSKTGELNDSLKDILGEEPVYDVTLALNPIESMVQLKGTISGKIPHACSRCAEDFSQDFAKSFTMAFYKSEESLQNFGSGVEIGPESVADSGSFELEQLEGNIINLEDIVHEQIALEIPFQPLCESDCKGLCSQCGTNLNTTDCQCSDSETLKRKSPFEVLKSLRGE